ncbi:MAG: hypothetical protein AAB542_02715 [Patescibacteria group bacterium]
MDIKGMRPFLVVPKLIEQPTWGGTYIVETKNWQNKPVLSGKKIGQSYELYDKSNLSLSATSEDPLFIGEIADNRIVEQQTTVSNSIALTQLIAQNPAEILGKRIVDAYGPTMHLLLKFTQALGNSFQLHIPDGTDNPHWKAKPESWYYFEPGLITCGVKKGVNWQDYKTAVTLLDNLMQKTASQVQAGTLAYEKAKGMIAELVKLHDPWQYVNLVRVEKGTLLDLSPCGIHHSWEEDLDSIPLGNVLYEIQLNVMDDVSTLRSFDKGKMSKEGKLRSLQIDDYFAFADRSEETNDPHTHMRKPKTIAASPSFTHERLLETKYYSMDRVIIPEQGKKFMAVFDTFRHIFVRSGSVVILTGSHTLTVTTGHSAFVPAACSEYAIRASIPDSEILISY